MWGNDHAVKDNADTQTSFAAPPDKTKINTRLKETAINDGPELPPTHLGWNGRLNGPVDNPISSCMSCHMTAQFPSAAPMNPSFQSKYKFAYNPAGNAYWMRWFQNIDCTVPFGNYVGGGVPEPGVTTLSTDYSLQLAISITNFCDANPHAPVCGQPVDESDDASDKAAAILGATQPRRRARAKRIVAQPIVRDVPESRPRQK